jgi:lipopolysaccharide/colanic/teichoic acid biosynthesis glycosyltransferase
MIKKNYHTHDAHRYHCLRFNYRVMFFITALMSTFCPAFLFWGWGFWCYLDLVKVNTVMSIFITSIMAGFFLIRLFRYPGVNTLAYMIPTVTVTYGILFGVLLIFRLDYSRPVIITSYIFILVSCWIIYYLGVKYGKVKYSIIPVGNYQSLCAMNSVQWDILHTPELSLNFGDAIVADFCSSELTSEWQRLLADCVLSGIPIYHSNKIYESLTGRISVELLYENEIGSMNPSLIYLSFKRLIDLFIVITTFPILLPLMVITAILIRLESAGPIFFMQNRVGLGNKNFVMYKFRSMYSNQYLGDATFAQKFDVRVTRVGNFIRKYRIDELPQFFNVFKGDMSLIGPRPEQRFFVEKFEHELPFYMYRHILRPGISGWAQVMHGYSADTDSTRIKLEYDFFYIKNVSLWLDLLIVFKTIKTMLTGFGSR